MARKSKAKTAEQVIAEELARQKAKEAEAVDDAVCPECDRMFPVFKDDGEFVECPECGEDCTNLYWLNHKRESRNAKKS